MAFAAQSANAQATPRVDASVTPAAFNPAVSSTVISYTLSNLQGPAVSIKATNASGGTVRAWDAGVPGNGQYTLAWNGKDNKGIVVPQGAYTVNVSALVSVPATQQYAFQYSVPAVPGRGAFYYPYYVATDAKGNLYITDDYHHLVQKYDGSGKFLLQWGGYGTGIGQFRYPAGIAVDSSGNVYVSDTGNNRVEKFDANGKYLAQWGSYGTGNGQFKAPYGLVIDSNGNVLVADPGNGRIERFSAAGAFQAAWGTPGTGNGQFQSPSCIAVAPDGRVFVTDSRSMRVQVFSAAGGYLAGWGTYGSGNGQFNTPYGIAIDNAGNVYVADGKNNRVQVFDLNGKYLNKWGQTGSGSGQFIVPVGVAIAGNSVIVVDCWNHRYQSFSAKGSAGQPVQAMFSAQANVVVDSTPPTITLTTPASGASYSLNQKVQASWSAADSLSGIRTSSGTVASGASLDTSKAGTYSFTVQATDNAGNVANLSRSYTVTGSASPTPTPKPTPSQTPTVTPTPTPTLTATVQFITSTGSNPLYHVELARTSAEINRGLMYRTSLAADAGMLFIFSGDGNHYFYMANTYIPLDMVYITSKNVVVGVVANATPLSTALITPPGPCHYVLEINGGQAALKGIRQGDTVKITGA